MARIQDEVAGSGFTWAGLNETTKDVISALVCFSFFALLYGFTSHASASASDEIATFRTGVVFAATGHLAIDDIKSVQKITDIGVWGRGDHLYSKYFPGTALGTAIIYPLAAKPDDTPYYAPNPTYGHVLLAPSEAGARAALMINAVLGALGMAMLLLLLQENFPRKTAITTVLLVGLTTDWWYESQLFYLEIGAGAFLIGSLYFANKGNPWPSSLSFALSLLFRPTNIIALPIWGYSVWHKNSKMLLSGIFILGGAAFLGLYNYLRFRSPFDFGYGGTGFNTPILTGLLGLILSPGHSFFIYSPILILGITGGILLWRKDKTLALVCLAASLGYILMAATWQSWSGGKVWGSRLIVPVIPIAGVLVAAAIEQLYSSPTRKLIATVLIVAVLGLSIQVMVVLQNPAIAIQDYTHNGYATVTESTWSPTKNWLALEMKSLTQWNICNTGSYSLRAWLSQCQQAPIPE
jgi:hypothetical protein